MLIIYDYKLNPIAAAFFLVFVHGKRILPSNILTFAVFLKYLFLANIFTCESK